MKKIFSILFFFSALFVFSGCSSDDDELTMNELTVAQSDLNFMADGGSGSIVIVDAGVTLTATTNIEADWCTVTVSGNVVTVKTKENTSVDGRSLKVIVKGGDKSVSVPCVQEGAVFWLKDIKSTMAFTSAGGVIKSAVVFSLALEIENLPAWLTYETKNDSIYFIVAASNQLKQQVITIKSGKRQQVVNVSQASYDAYLGNWNFTYTDDSGVRTTEIVTITQNVNGVSFSLSPLVITGSYTATLTPRYNASKASLILASGTFLRQVGSYYVFTCISDSEAGYFTWSTTVQMESVLTLSESSVPTLTFVDNGTWGSYNADTYQFNAFSSSTASSSTHLGYFKVMEHIVMTKR